MSEGIIGDSVMAYGYNYDAGEEYIRIRFGDNAYITNLTDEGAGSLSGDNN